MLAYLCDGRGARGISLLLQMKNTRLERLHNLLKDTQLVEELEFILFEDLTKFEKNSEI